MPAIKARSGTGESRPTAAGVSQTRANRRLCEERRPTGLLAGAIAKAIMPGDDPGRYIVTAIIGVMGALLGGFVGAELIP